MKHLLNTETGDYMKFTDSDANILMQAEPGKYRFISKSAFKSRKKTNKRIATNRKRAKMLEKQGHQFMKRTSRDKATTWLRCTKDGAYMII